MENIPPRRNSPPPGSSPRPQVAPATATHLTPDQVANELQLSRNKVYGLLAQGEIKASRVGGVHRIARRDLEKYLADCANA